MGILCNAVQLAAILFLALSFIVAAAETGIALAAKRKALEAGTKAPTDLASADLDGLAKAIEALKGLLLALKDLPAWIALFLAALALVWTATSAPHLCT